MHEAKVAVFEDQQLPRAFAVDSINYSPQGHKVVAEAETLGEALRVIDRIGNGELEVDAIVLDANLAPRSNEGRDAETIIEKLRELNLPQKIIGYSMQPMAHYGIEVDADLTKEKAIQDWKVFAEILDNL